MLIYNYFISIYYYYYWVLLCKKEQRRTPGTLDNKHLLILHWRCSYPCKRAKSTVMSGAVLFAQRRRRKNRVTGGRFKKFLPCYKFFHHSSHKAKYGPTLPVAETTREHYVQSHKHELEIIVNGKPMKRLVVLHVDPYMYTILNLLEELAINILQNNTEEAINTVDSKYKLHVKNFNDITKDFNQNCLLFDLGFKAGQTMSITVVKRLGKVQ